MKKGAEAKDDYFSVLGEKNTKLPIILTTADVPFKMERQNKLVPPLCEAGLFRSQVKLG